MYGPIHAILDDTLVNKYMKATGIESHNVLID